MAVVMLATGNHIKLPNSLFLTVRGSIFSGEPSFSVTILLLATLWAMDTLAIQTTRNICRKSFYMQSNPGLLFFYCYTVSDSTFLRIPSTKLQTVEKVVSCVYGNNNLSAYKVLSDELKVSMAHTRSKHNISCGCLAFSSDKAPVSGVFLPLLHYSDFLPEWLLNNDVKWHL